MATKKKNTSRVLFLLGADPGVKNHGLAVTRVEVSEDGVLQMDVLGHTKLQYRLEALDNPYKDITKYLQGVEKFFRSCVPKTIKHPDAIVIERFQTRGFRGGQIELISMMIAAQVLQYGAKSEAFVLTAATWKNQINKQSPGKAKILDTLYKGIKTEHGIEPHNLDATLMTLYAAGKMFSVEPYARFKIKKNVSKLMLAMGRSAK